MSALPAVSSINTVRCGARYSALLAGVSIAALFLSNPHAAARPLGGSAQSPSAAAVAAAQDAAKAAQAAGNSLNRAALAFQAQQAARDAARAALQAMPDSVPNGLRPGGLRIGTGVVGPDGSLNRNLWRGADLPTEFANSDRVNVDIKQREQRAILTWDSFNVGGRTDLRFDQQGNRDWVALNRVLNANARPSQILGNIKADGSVYVINQNGIIFGGGSQVNVGALIASTAHITDNQFLNGGIYSTKLSDGSYQPSFMNAGGLIKVEAGAQINTHAPQKAEQGGGFVLVLGTEVENAGSISTPKGQTQFAAGDHFILRPGYGTDANQSSTTNGNEIVPLLNSPSAGGLVRNSGVVFSQQGDITLAGRTIEQNGLLMSTTSVDTRGTIHLLNSVADTKGSVTLGAGSVTTILPELASDATALNGKRDALIKASGEITHRPIANAQFDNLSTMDDRLDQSRVEIVTGGSVVFKGGSITQVQGGQIVAEAPKARIFVESNAVLDVSGTRGVLLPMSVNNIEVNIQGNELRDSPVNRESSSLKNANVWIDLRDLVLVPAGTGGYESDRYYTPGGLLEVSGYLGNVAHKIGEWTAVGGTITLSAKEVVAQQHAIFDISGGSVTYEGGYITTTNFLGADGRTYNINNARADMQFDGLGGDFIRDHERWNVKEIWASPLGKGRTSRRWEDGYTVGRDAGNLVLSTPTSIFEGDILADVVTGERQTGKRPSGASDGYKLGQNVVAQAGSLELGKYSLTEGRDAYVTEVILGQILPSANTVKPSDSLPSDRVNTAWFDAAHLNAQGLGGLEIRTRDSITVDAPLALANGGALSFTAPVIDFKAAVTAHGGRISTTNVLRQTNTALTLDGLAAVTLHAGVTLDASGLWSNGLLDRMTLRLASLDGGAVSLQSSQSVIMESGSVIDVSSGAAILADGKAKGGKGGNVTIEANVYVNSSSTGVGDLVLDGELRGYGFEGGGSLSVGGAPVLIADDATALEAGQILLTPDFFKKGFSQYEIKGSLINSGSVTIAEGTAVNVEMPVYRFTDAAHATFTGADPAAALEIWTPPLYLENIRDSTFVQRKGASFALSNIGEFSLGTGSLIEVDPGQSIAISALGQVTIDGRLNAWGGAISINSGVGANAGSVFVPGLSIWIGSNAVLDVAARAVTGVDRLGRPYADVRNGGTIKIGAGSLTPNENGLLDSLTPAFVIIRPGAVLDASGTSATIDLAAGGNPLAGSDVRALPSNGGAITLASTTGLVLDGEMHAAAGGVGAAGGSLNLILESAFQRETSLDVIRQPRILTITQARQPSSLPADLQPGEHHAAMGYTKARLSAGQVEAGGFSDLSLWSSDIIAFEGDVSLHLDRSLALQRGVISVADTTPQAQVVLAAPVVRLDGAVRRENSGQAGINPTLRNVSAGSWRPGTTNGGRLTVDADLIDIGDWVRFGASDSYDVAFRPGAYPQTITLPIEAPGFAEIRLTSRGDIRFRDGSLATAGNLTLTATQIYPVTGASATILAGAMPDNSSGIVPRPDGVLAIRSNGKSADLPSSVFGSLGLIAGIIEQDGVLRAPLGTIRFGGSVGQAGFYQYQSGGHVILGDGSITSVSAAGLVVPYGGTVDGIKYLYNGRELSLPDLMTLDAMGQIEIVSDRFEAAPGAVLDLTGGGELAGSGFMAGRGGSVDILRTPLLSANPGFGFSAAGNKAYAIIPGYASGYAPIVQEKGAGDPAIGQQITIPSGIPGLPAGTYTLLPSTYALMPGAYRVEIGGSLPRENGAVPLGNGSYVASARLAVANTAIRSVLPNQIIVTPEKTVRTHSQYNAASYSTFALETAARFGTTRARLPIDGKQLVLSFEEAGNVLDFKGTALFAPGEGGYAGTLLVESAKPLEIKASAAAATTGMATLDAEDLSRFNAGTLLVGAEYWASRGLVTLVKNSFGGSDAITVRSGAVLEAGQILLAGNEVLVEDGAVLDTTRSAFAVPDSTLGYVFANGNSPESVTFGSVLVVANGWFNLLPAVVPKDARPSTLTVADGAILRTRGTIGFIAADQLSLGQAQLNTRYLALSLPAVNVGTEASFAAAEAAGVLGTGWNLTQTTLDRLLNPASTNLAVLERLSISVRDAINFYGNVTLDARNGGDGETMVVLNTPAIYGWGQGTSAILAADTLVWNGVAAGDGSVTNPYVSLKPPAVQPGGAGTGSGQLTLAAREIHFGYDPLARSQSSAELERLALGFTSVDIIAGEKVTANNRGSVSFYHSGTDAASYSGGNLAISTPLFTADSGAMIDIRAGGTITVSAAGKPADPSARSDLGGEIRLQGAAIALDTTVALPSGRLVMTAQDDIVLGNGALIDLAGRAVSFYEVTKYSWGGTLEMESRAASIIQAAGSVIDVSASNNDAGSIKASAVGGTATFGGTLRGGSSDGSSAGSFSLAANTIADFASLNTKLNASSFFGTRSFTTRSGDLVIGDEVKARIVNIAADGGSLIVNGRIDASGEKVGTIRLSARDNLTLTSNAVLDAHGTVLQTDSYGAPIDASNRASIELTARNGAITLAGGSTIDMRSADGISRGRLEINAPRVGADGIAINAASRVNILGAASVAVNGFRNYTPLDGIINQAYLDGIHADNAAFIDAAGVNSASQAQLAGLKDYGAAAFHLRPGVEITSEGDLVTSGDLDLSGYRYGTAADANIRGSGEPGVLVVRAGGNFTVNGSINDGFAPPPPTPDDSNWADGRAGRMWAVSEMLAPGSLSWSMRFVSGADLAASDTRAVRPIHSLGEAGDLVLDDRHSAGGWILEAISVVRTGTGYLDLIAGGDYRHASLFGVYTAGTALVETQNHAGLWLTEGGGDVRVEAGGTMAGYNYMSDLNTNQSRINEWLRWQDGAWGINFGSYVPDSWGLDQLVGFSGIGTLGGGNVNVIAGGDAGAMTPQIMEIGPINSLFETRASALVVAIGGSGYVDANGVLRQTGGGDLVINIGGRLNTAPLYSANYPGGGTLVNVRGDVSVTASAIGLVSEMSYGIPLGYTDPRPIDPMRPYNYYSDSGLFLALGDSRATINTRGDLVILYATDPGLPDPAAHRGLLPSTGGPGFSLWSNRTALDLFSAGGSVAPITSDDSRGPNDYYSYSVGYNARPYPPALGVVAAGGDVLVFGQANLTPSPNARLDLLARDSIYYGYNPSYPEGNYLTIWGDGADRNAITNPMRFYAVHGDITNFHVGYIQSPTFERPETLYIGGGPVWMRAGRDIIAAGGVDDPNSDWRDEAGGGGLIVHSRDDDISVIQAGRDIIYANLQVAGPGVLALTAGRHIYQADQGRLQSIGPAVPGDKRPGASIVLQAGAGSSGPDYAALIRYLDPANLAISGTPLAEQPGKAVKTYENELVAWLKEQRGFAGKDEDALSYFQTLPRDLQAVFLRTIFYNELRQSGIEYNDAASPRHSSYLRGRQSIAMLFPDRDANGNPIRYQGDITLFGGSGVTTQFGGDIQLLAPGGQVVLGVEGEVPPSTAGLITQGEGNIDIYSKGSILLGLSRIMTTYGGDILGWSAEGDINAGRGSKTTVVYTPARRRYDVYGHAQLSPTVPSTGAGIAAIASVPDIPPARVDLIAPLGTIDVGEAGIRSSGQVNVAALQIVNAANIQAQGAVTGVPTVQAPNIGGLTQASNLAGAAQQTTMPTQNSASGQASIIIVEFLGFGGGSGEDDRPAEPRNNNRQSRLNYDSDSTVRVLGNGPISAEQTSLLTDEEKKLIAEGEQRRRRDAAN
ncbi:filamentous haemagglutinin family protein [Bradyrhizobium cenepequi]